MSELSVVLEDLERGVYERTMVANEQLEAAEGGQNPCMNHTSPPLLIAVYIYIYTCSWKGKNTVKHSRVLFCSLLYKSKSIYESYIYVYVYTRT